MNVRKTSIEAYNRIVNEGLLSKMRIAVYRELFAHGPLTGSELNARLSSAEHRATFHKRLSELRDLGVVCEVGEKVCSVTGNKVIAWDVTANLPGKPEVKRKAPKSALEAEVEDLRRQVRELKDELNNAGCLFCRAGGAEAPSNDGD